MDIIDVIRLSNADPSILKDEKRLTEFRLTTSELEVVRKLDPNTIRVLVEGIERLIRERAVASSQACTGGTQACVGRPLEAAGGVVGR